jgi:hypothetical protein
MTGMWVADTLNGNQLAGEIHLMKYATEVEVRVWASTAEVRYLVLPERPVGTGA